MTSQFETASFNKYHQEMSNKPKSKQDQLKASKSRFLGSCLGFHSQAEAKSQGFLTVDPKGSFDK